jgi:maltooligosyltrehalose trehalohydrolase
VGTASPDGTLDGLVRYVERLAGIGVNAVELMPLAEFPGDRGWGYDGVFPFAVHHACGGPRALRRFVEACHELAVAVIVDVVDNHVGPEGNVLRGFGPYFTDRYRTPWGDAINFDGPGSDEVRRFFGGNALMWLEEFGVDALRVDAIHGIVDTTARPFLLELAEAVRDLDERDGRPRRLIAESALGDVRTVTPLDGGGIGFDAQWNDEFHHALHALLTGERTGYYADFGRVQDLADAFQRGFVYRGRRSAFHRRRQGSDSSHLPPERFVVFAQNHDQIGNRMRGERMEVPFGRRKVALGLTLLAPGVPLLFQGEEYGETAPFPYFISHTDRELVEDVRRGRREEFASFGWEGEPPDPQALSTFESARLRPTSADGGEHAALLAWTTELLGLRHRIPALRGGVPATAGADEERRLLTVRRQDGGSAAVLVVNFGDRPSDGRPDGFRLVLHSEDERWGGEGTGESLPPGSLALWVRASG